MSIVPAPGLGWAGGAGRGGAGRASLSATTAADPRGRPSGLLGRPAASQESPRPALGPQDKRSPSTTRCCRYLVPDFGVHGGAEPRWWLLYIAPARDRVVMAQLETWTKGLPPLVGPDGKERERTLEMWAPVKRVQAWNPK